MTCEVFQTLISRELPPEQRATNIDEAMQAMQGDPGKALNDFGFDCGKIEQMKSAAMQSIKTGKGVDGRPINIRDVQALTTALVDACVNPTVNTVRRMIEISVDRQIATCKVQNYYSKMQFRWNEQTKNWISQEGPIGPCGTINISTLERDQTKYNGISIAGSNLFWFYTQKRLFTNPGGEFSPGVACSKFPEHTTRYSWYASPDLAECRYIQHVTQ
jgi:hypothetical protein